MGKYDDIINLPHHVSKKHPQMSLHDRAAQFAPFAALTGYDEEVKEVSRITDQFHPLESKKKKKSIRSCAYYKKYSMNIH